MSAVAAVAEPAGARRAGSRSGPALTSRTAVVLGRRVSYASGGDGLPVVFLHGWALGHRAYRQVLEELADSGCRVVAPSLPGFGGTASLPGPERTMEGYAAWVDAFLDEIGLDEPAMVVGHSFGGGVGARLAFERADRVRYLVLINSVGGPTYTAVPGGARKTERPLWQYPVNFARELFWTAGGIRIADAIRDDLFGNMVRNPLGVAEIGFLARRADLTVEFEELRRRELPVMVLWSDHDGIIPTESFDALCAAIGTDGQVIEGGHSWLLANPRALTDVVDNVVRVETQQAHAHGLRATTTELRRLLRRTRIPASAVKRLLDGASPLWMLSESPTVVAADLALCHPPLAPGEVRAVARPVDGTASYRVTVIAQDRPGLLADTAGALAEEGFSVATASATTWRDPDIALHSLTVDASGPVDGATWDALGTRLRAAAEAIERRAPVFVPDGRARVTMSGEGEGVHLVRVSAPDQVGLLEAITRWLAERGIGIESARITTRDGQALDTFLVDSAVDVHALAAHLSRPPAWRIPGWPGHRCSLSTLVPVFWR